MKRLGSAAIVVLACFSLVAAFAVLAPTPASGQARRASEVVVTNPTSAPVPVRNVDERGRQPFHEQVNVSTNTTHMADGTITIPAGKRLVVEYVSAYVGAPGPAVAVLYTEEGMYNAGAFLSVDKVRNSTVGTSDWKMYFGGEMVRYYAEGTLRVNVYVDAGFPWNAYVNVFGYLVDVP